MRVEMRNREGKIQIVERMLAVGLQLSVQLSTKVE
jgi:hypothetical protein